MRGAGAPTRADARLACEHGLRCGHNYPSELVGTSDCDEEAPGQRARLEGQRRRSWAIDRTRARVGRGARAYERAVKALKSWEHFDLGWARVSRESGTAVGDAVCVEARVAGVWIRNPLRIVELREREKRASGGASSSSGARAKARFAFAHGTLGGHWLAGEGRFAVGLAGDGVGVGGGGGGGGVRVGGGGGGRGRGGGGGGGVGGGWGGRGGG